MTPRSPWLLAAAALALAAPAAPATSAPEPPTYRQEHGAAALHFEVDAGGEPVEVRLWRTLQVTLSVEGPAGLTVEPPEKITTSPGWRAGKPLPPQTSDLGNGRRMWQQTFPVSPAVAATAGKPAEIELQIAPLRYRDAPDKDFTEVTWGPIPVRVTSELAKADKDELRPITPPEEPPPTPRSWLARWLPWLGLGVAVGGSLLVAGWAVRRRLAAPASPPTPNEWAAQELDRIAAMGLPEAGEVERYHTLLSDVVRGYLERRFALPASHQTTAEFLETMRRAPQLTPAQQGLLRDFLGRCDMAKFARAAPPPEECRAVADMARAFVRETAPGPPAPAAARE